MFTSATVNIDLSMHHYNAALFPFRSTRNVRNLRYVGLIALSEYFFSAVQKKNGHSDVHESQRRLSELRSIPGGGRKSNAFG
jgi:hypothetical protein